MQVAVLASDAIDEHGEDNQHHFDEGKAATQEDGHDSLGNQMEDECTDASRKQGGGRVETDEQRHQYRRAKGYEQKLDANNGLSRGG